MRSFRSIRRWGAGAGALALAGGALSIGTSSGTATAAVQTACTPGLGSIAAQSGVTGYRYYRGYIDSWDCTPIVFNLFEPEDASASHPVYTILEGPGWGGAGATTPDSQLIANDYAELTWDPRGFGDSGGVAEVDSPDAEGRDVSALIDYVLASRKEIARDSGTKGVRYMNDTSGHNSYGQPAVGMTGVSYGGGIEFATASFDNRVKTIAPGWAWNDLDYSLFPGDVIKLGWDQLLFGAGLGESAATHAAGDAGQSNPAGTQAGGFDPNIYESEAEGAALGYPDQQTLGWFAQRSMSGYGSGPSGHVPEIPTLLIQGTVDTLFNLSEAWANHDMIAAAHPKVPIKMIAFCGGHVSCPTGATPTGAGYSDTASSSSPIGAKESASTFTENATIAWFDKYLRGRSVTKSLSSLATSLPAVTYQDQNGNFYGLKSFPTFSAPGQAHYVTKAVSGTLVSHGLATGATGAPVGEDTAVTDGATPSSDPGQVTVPLLTAPAHADVPIVGEGHVNLSVTVDGSSTNLFFRLIDENTGDVLDLQTTALRMDNLDLVDNGADPNLPPAAQKVSLDLIGTAYDLPAGDTLELQVSTSTQSFSANRGTAVVSLSGTASVPTLSPEG